MAARRLFDDILAWTRLPPEPDPCGSRGGRVRVHEVALRVAAGGYACHDTDAERLARSALPVVQSRIAIPEVGGRIDPAQHLRGVQREEFLDLAGRELPVEQWGEPVKACHRIAGDDELALLKKMAAVGMGRFILQSEVITKRLELGAHIDFT